MDTEAIAACSGSLVGLLKKLEIVYQICYALVPDSLAITPVTPPKFRNISTWHQAERLMQPAFIRLLDNLRKQLEHSTWKGDYEEIPLWGEGVSQEVQAEVAKLRSQLAQAISATEVNTLEQALADLPAPFPGYLLHLSQEERRVTLDIWELCYQICFRDYDVDTGTSRPRGFGQAQGESAEVDLTLFDGIGEVDWNRLEDKTRRLVEQLFGRLPE